VAREPPSPRESPTHPSSHLHSSATILSLHEQQPDGAPPPSTTTTHHRTERRPDTRAVPRTEQPRQQKPVPSVPRTPTPYRARKPKIPPTCMPDLHSDTLKNLFFFLVLFLLFAGASPQPPPTTPGQARPRPRPKPGPLFFDPVPSPRSACLSCLPALSDCLPCPACCSLPPPHRFGLSPPCLVFKDPYVCMYLPVFYVLRVVSPEPCLSPAD